MVEAGWEVASHGYRWIDYLEMPEDEEREHIRLAIETIERVAGQRPVGWYTGRISDNTRRLVVEAGGFLYDSDSYADELPYWVDVDGTPQLILPYTLDNNDFKFLLVNGFVTAEEFSTYLRDAFDVLYAEGATAPKMMSVGLHCRIIGRPGRMRRPRAIPRLRGEAPRRVGDDEGGDRPPLASRASLRRGRGVDSRGRTRSGPGSRWP